MRAIVAAAGWDSAWIGGEPCTRYHGHHSAMAGALGDRLVASSTEWISFLAVLGA